MLESANFTPDFDDVIQGAYLHIIVPTQAYV